jgi:hypothetical protein
MTEKRTLTSEEISAIVDGLNPIDWTQMELMAKMPPGKRIYPSLRASAIIRAGLRAAFKRRFPPFCIGNQPEKSGLADIHG